MRAELTAQAVAGRNSKAAKQSEKLERELAKARSVETKAPELSGTAQLENMLDRSSR
jgi:hypothetical protein